MSTTLRLTLDEYHRMIARGAFNDLRGRHIELIRGELREMAPQGPWHSDTVRWLTNWSRRSIDETQAALSIQLPLSIPNLDSEPEPDIVWAKPKSYRMQHPQPDDVLLLIEVAHSSLSEDLGENARLYAAAGIRDYWVIDLAHTLVHVFRGPSPSGYASEESFGEGAVIYPLAAPHAALVVSELFAD